jgi:hypothetical protein
MVTIIVLKYHSSEVNQLMIDAEQIQHKIMSIYCDYKAQKNSNKGLMKNATRKSYK